MKQTKLNLIKEYKTYYTAKTIPEIVEIEEGKFFNNRRKRSAGSDEFQSKVSALYSLAYSVKNACKGKR